MEVPADRSRPTSALPLDPSLREAVRSPRRRRLTVAIFARGLRGPAVTATVIDDAVVGWLAGLYGPGMTPLLRGLARSGSWCDGATVSSETSWLLSRLRRHSTDGQLVSPRRLRLWHRCPPAPPWPGQVDGWSSRGRHPTATTVKQPFQRQR